MPWDIVHRAAPCRNVPVTFTLGSRRVAVRTTHQTAFVLIRVLGLAAIILGCKWIVNLLGAFTMLALQVPRWLLDPILGYTVQGLLSGPIWLLSGLLVFWKSASLARFAAASGEDDAA